MKGLIKVISRILPDKLYLTIKYRIKIGKWLKWKKPESFNEKLQWLKLYDRNPLYTTMVDKYEAKEYVENIIGKEYVIPTLGVWENFDEIDFDKLPNKFVLKCTHDSGGLIICKDKSKLDKEEAKRKIEKCLKTNYFWTGREWPYKNVKPRIIAEKYMIDESGYELKDYKFFCFNGKVMCFKIDFDRQTIHRANYYDTKGNQLPFFEKLYPADFEKKIELPTNLSVMIEKAEQLANGFPFVRVDFYNVNQIIYFGEITFFPAGGTGRFEPDTWDKTLGEWLELPKRRKYD